ncbi:hypothetical protein C2U68_17895 [Methylomonas koyamae]|nr:hypothetical protein C2U68_17895 [Methylomonas koyamae]
MIDELPIGPLSDTKSERLIAGFDWKARFACSTASESKVWLGSKKWLLSLAIVTVPLVPAKV